MNTQLGRVIATIKNGIAPPDDPCIECGRYGCNSVRYLNGEFVQYHAECLERVMRASRVALYAEMVKLDNLGRELPRDQVAKNFSNREQRIEDSATQVPVEF